MVTSDDFEALERLAYAQRDALLAMAAQVRALALATAALMGSLDERDRASVRDAASDALGDDGEHALSASLVEAFARDPAAALEEQRVATSAPEASRPIQPH